MSDINDTNPEVEEEVIETTPEETPEETVETYSEELDKAETEEEAIAAFEKVDRTEDSQEDSTGEDAEYSEELDTPPEEVPSNILNLKNGDIELGLNLDDEKERAKIVRLAQQGLNYAEKTTELAKYKSFVQYAEENGISLEDIQKLSDAKAGNKDAISAIAKDADVDVYDLDSDGDYKPEPIQLPTQVDPRLDVTANEILSNDEYRESFQKWFPTMPQDVQDAVTGDANVLHGVQEDLEAGVFAPAMEQAYKYQKLDGMDFGSAYTRAKNEVIAIRGEQSTPTVTRGEKVRASGSRPTASNGTRKGSLSVGVISDMSDDDFMAQYQDLARQAREQAEMQG